MARSLSIQEKTSYATNAFASIGIGKEAAFGILGSLAGESGRNLNTGAFNAKDPNGGSIGIGQWHSERRTGLENFKSQWGSPKDFRHQIDYVVHELKTTHKGVADKLRDPNVSRSKAATVWTREYERPAKSLEHLAERKANATYFSKMDADRPKSPQQAVDRTSPHKSLDAIGAATASIANGSKVGLTGAVMTGQPETPKSQTAAAQPQAPAQVAQAAPAATPAAPAFDMGRFGPNIEPTMSVAKMDTPQALAAFDAGRFGTTPTQSLQGIAALTAALASPATPISQPAPTTAYVDPVVNAAGARAAAASASKSTTSQSKSTKSNAEPFDALFGGINTAVTNISTPTAAPSAPVGNKSQEVADSAESKAKAAGENTKAASQGGIAGFIGADATVGAFLGSMVGGYFGGPLGAIAGGLVGQGINNAVTGGSKAKTDAIEKQQTGGIAGGLGRSMDNFFGGISNMFGGFNPADISTTANPNGISFDANGFPSAPEAWSGGYNASGFSESQQQAASDWASDNPDVASSPGLY